MRWKLSLSVFFVLILAGIYFWPYIYKTLDNKYQNAQDPRRIKHITEIANVAFAYDKKVGYAPLYDLVENQNRSFMVLIGRSDKEEDQFAKLSALNRGALFINSTHFERILSKGLNHNITLPRDPQKVPTYAPNVYVYSINKEQMCVAAHLFKESKISKPYTWEGGTFHSHAKCYKKKK